jgi:mRNA interferase MazF
VYWGAIDVLQKGVTSGLQDVRWGRIYYADLPKQENSSVQGGRRPVIAISNDRYNERSPVINIVPVTSSLKNMDFPTHIPVDCLRLPSMALCEQPMSIDKNRLLYQMGSLAPAVMKQIIDTLYNFQFNGNLQAVC